MYSNGYKGVFFGQHYLCSTTKKYTLAAQEITEFLTELRNSTVVVTPLRKDQLPLRSRDPKDDKFLACAFGGKCDYLVTGDGDLLVLKGDKALGKIEIIKAADFLKKLRVE